MRYKTKYKQINMKTNLYDVSFISIYCTLVDARGEQSIGAIGHLPFFRSRFKGTEGKWTFSATQICLY